jgi:hypothetical protein
MYGHSRAADGIAPFIDRTDASIVVSPQRCGIKLTEAG